MRRFISVILFLTIASLAISQPGRAQNNIQLSSLDVYLMPEYDQPDMLVILKVTIPADLTQDLFTFRIPKTTEGQRPYQLAHDVDGVLYTTIYTPTITTDWVEITFAPQSTQFQLEYYDTALHKLGASRSYEYTWPGDYEVNKATIIIKEPVDASHMQFVPANVTVAQEEAGPEYLHNVGSLRKGQTYTFSLSYQKPTDTLAINKLVPVGTLPNSMWIRGLPWALGILAVVLIVGGVWVYWRSGLPQGGDKKRRRRKAAVRAASSDSSDETGVYCHNCGRRASIGDVFCRSCGTKLRI